MSLTTPSPFDPPHEPVPSPRPGKLSAMLAEFRSKMLSGLLAALPLALTFFIVNWLYVTLTTFVLTPAIEVVRYILGNHGLSETFWYRYFSPILAILLVGFLLYAFGLFVQSRLARAVDWVMLHIPVVNTIFKALRNLFDSLGQQLKGDTGFKRVVLVEFPQPGMRSLGLVTNSLNDATTGRTILCVTVLTGVMPPSGFTLFVPEENVTEIDWSMNETLQAILSGGINAPKTIHYFQGARRSQS